MIHEKFSKIKMSWKAVCKQDLFFVDFILSSFLIAITRLVLITIVFVVNLRVLIYEVS